MRQSTVKTQPQSAPTTMPANQDCLIVDDDSREDLWPIICSVEKLGFNPVHVRRPGELADELGQYTNQRTRPAVMLIDVYLPDWRDLRLLGKNLLIEDSNIAGIILYEHVLLNTEGISSCPVIFISNHKNIAVLAAHKLRLAGKRCLFLSKDDFPDGSKAFLQPLISKQHSDKTRGFYDQDYEMLWAGVCEYFNLSDQEKFTVLGARPEGNIDLLRFLSISRDAFKRIDALVDIGVCLQILYPNEGDRKVAIAAKDQVVEGSVRQIIGRGDFDEIKLLLLRLDELCGSK